MRDNIYPKGKPVPDKNGLSIQPIEGREHMNRIIHTASGCLLPGRYTTNEVKEARDRLLTLEIDWAQDKDAVLAQLAARFTFDGFDWSELQLFNVASMGQLHEFKTYEEVADQDRREYLLALQASKFGIVGMFVHAA